MAEYNELFTRENVEKINVPSIVKDDLLSIVEEKLKKAGFYYRIAYRVKTVESILNKLKLKDYGREGSENEDRKMQDLIGMRIILYYDDDVEIVKNLLDSIFSSAGVWDTTEANEYEFRAMKINGIFQLPAYLSKTIVNPELQDYIDDTFEIQVRTNSFEGWHEIEHDMRYKGSAFGAGNEGLARKMNSILATLELCDDSLVSLIEDLGHQHYKEKKWNYMLRCHYRLKFSNEPLHPYIIEVFDEDKELAKKFYKFKRGLLIKQLWDATGEKGTKITVNNVVRIVNQIGPDDKRLHDVFERLDQEKKDKEKENTAKRRKFEPFKELGEFMVFKADTFIDLTNLSIQDAFKKATGYIYSWIKSRFDDVFDELPETVDSYMELKPGYSMKIDYDNDRMYFFERTTHLDTKIPTRVWISEATIEAIDGKLSFKVSNRYAEPADRYRDNDNMLFSRPNFFGEIADNIGIIDVEKMKESVRYVDESNEYDELTTLISDENRKFPVIVFIATDNQWIDKFDINYFAYLVGFYAHIKRIRSPYVMSKFAKDYGLKKDGCSDSITVFYPGKSPQTSYKPDILDTTYEVIKVEKRKYWNENGCRAYRRLLVSEIREHNVLD